MQSTLARGSSLWYRIARFRVVGLLCFHDRLASKPDSGMALSLLVTSILLPRQKLCHKLTDWSHLLKGCCIDKLNSKLSAWPRQCNHEIGCYTNSMPVPFQMAHWCSFGKLSAVLRNQCAMSGGVFTPNSCKVTTVPKRCLPWGKLMRVQQEVMLGGLPGGQGPAVFPRAKLLFHILTWQSVT